VLVSVPLVDPLITRTVGLIRRRRQGTATAAQPLYDQMAALKQKPGRKKSA
jgi:hypothetical protein